MERQRHKALLIILALLGLSYWTSATMKDVMVLEDPAVAETLPTRVGEYEGKPVYYCQVETCHGNVMSDEPMASLVCPVCGGPVGIFAPAERRALPADTQLIKRRYLKPGEPPIYVAVVISGKDRLSLHRPQNCLPGQGYTIVGDREIAAKTGEPTGIGLCVLNLERRTPGAPESIRPEQSCYAYVYLAGDRKTSSQLQMMVWMAWDRLIHNEAHRWAYLSIASDRARETPGYDEARLASFAEQLYPLIAANPIRALK